MSGLSTRYAEILAFEAAGSWKYSSSKEAIVRERFDISITRYFQILNHIVSLPAALVFDPTTVRRLQQRRARFSTVRRTGLDLS